MRFLLWISAAEFPDDDNIPRRAIRQAKFLMWISAAEFTPDDRFREWLRE